MRLLADSCFQAFPTPRRSVADRGNGARQPIEGPGRLQGEPQAKLPSALTQGHRIAYGMDLPQQPIELRWLKVRQRGDAERVWRDLIRGFVVQNKRAVVGRPDAARGRSKLHANFLQDLMG